MIEARFPKIPRLVSGFEGVEALLPGRDFNVAKALTGTEGTCVIVLDAVVNLVPRPKMPGDRARCRSTTSLPPPTPCLHCWNRGRTGSRALTGKCSTRVRTSRSAAGLDAFPPGHGFLIVEAGGDTPEDAQATVRRMDRARRHRRAGATSSPTPASSSASGKRARPRLGSPRSFAASRNIGRAGKTAPCRRQAWRLPRDLEELFAEHGYTAALYGHFGDGVTHCRVNFDFHHEAGLASYRQFMREAASSYTSYGGSFSGEHGDGQSRAELLRIMYGDDLAAMLSRVQGDLGPRQPP